ncbi:hypothetical protein CBR_g50773 [Chara braunii]|uniref:NIF system FeS cluster assembly NifU C-terminal domain-containing protein n=1 Tax=Chara braunii TaxID=69332 RepID=A0A388K5S9_CHABU|nr:hypothetical protein CBR_g50773 [Chara braunii]|eukprot:GBG65412.1 hypothetical protein CBR_g50773 [Chara braunii]
MAAMAMVAAAGGVLSSCAATSRSHLVSNPIEQGGGGGGGRGPATCAKAAGDGVSRISGRRGARLEALAVDGCNNATCRFAIARDSARGEEVDGGGQDEKRETAEGEDMERGFIRLMACQSDRGRRGGLGGRHVANAWRPVVRFPAGQFSFPHPSSAPYPATATSANHLNRVIDRLLTSGMGRRRPRPNLSSRSQWEDDDGTTVQAEPLDLSEENIHSVLLEARTELLQIFDTSVGITGTAELADLDGPFVTIRLKGRFWHQRSVVLARLANYMKKRIPEILEVEIEDDGQLSDSPENF